MSQDEISREEDEERQRLLSSLRAWGVSHAAHFPTCSVAVYGSLARGDWWKTRDADLMVAGSGQLAGSCAKALDLWGRTEGVQAEVWIVEAGDIHAISAVAPERRTISDGRAPIQLGLHGFDTIDHHETVLGRDLLATVRVARTPSELAALARDRIRGLVTPRLIGSGDAPAKKAIEGMKAAAILLSAETSPPRPPTRDKRWVLAQFLELAPAFEGRETVERAWRSYRDPRLQPPSDADLTLFVQRLARALRCDAR